MGRGYAASKQAQGSVSGVDRPKIGAKTLVALPSQAMTLAGKLVNGP